MAAQNYANIEKNRQRTNNYIDLINTLKYEESWMPMKLIDIPKFESKNTSFGVNILSYSEKDKNITYYKHPNFDREMILNRFN